MVQPVANSVWVRAFAACGSSSQLCGSKAISPIVEKWVRISVYFDGQIGNRSYTRDISSAQVIATPNPKVLKSIKLSNDLCLDIRRRFIDTCKQPGADSSFPTGRCFLVGLLSRHWWDNTDHKLSVTSYLVSRFFYRRSPKSFRGCLVFNRAYEI